MMTNFEKLLMKKNNGPLPDSGGFDMIESVFADSFIAISERSEPSTDETPFEHNFKWEEIDCISGSSPQQMTKPKKVGELIRRLESGSNRPHGVNGESRQTVHKQGGKARAIIDIVAAIISQMLFIAYKGGLYHYSPPIWKLVDKNTIITCLLEAFNDDEILMNLNSGDFGEIYKFLITMPQLQIEGESLKQSNSFIVCVDGVYDIFNQKVLDHSADLYAFSFINVSAYEVMEEALYNNF